MEIDTTKKQSHSTYDNSLKNLKENKENEAFKLISKNYTKNQQIKTSPRVKYISTEEKRIHTDKDENTINKNISFIDIEEEAPPLEINLESTEELIQQEPTELIEEYTGIIDGDLTSEQINLLPINDSENIIESQLPDAESILFEQVQKKKFL